MPDGKALDALIITSLLNRYFERSCNWL